MSQCFIMQIMTDDMLARVTNRCAECYDEIKSGDTIHYDTQQYRYLCQKCHERHLASLEESREIVESEDGGLFC